MTANTFAYLLLFYDV